MLLKILIVGAILIGAMAALQNGRLLARAGLLGHCSVVVVGGRPDPTQQVCVKGRLDGYPDLTNKSCQYIGMRHNGEYWRCEAPIVSSQTPNG
jgi:hypothetical protein